MNFLFVYIKLTTACGWERRPLLGRAGIEQLTKSGCTLL